MTSAANFQNEMFRLSMIEKMQDIAKLLDPDAEIGLVIWNSGKPDESVIFNTANDMKQLELAVTSSYVRLAKTEAYDFPRGK